jgi:DHA2 family multidrug resistance protein-like MFS transporter
MIGRKSLPESPRLGSLDLLGTVLKVLMFGPIFIGVDMLTRGGVTWLGVAVLVRGIAFGVLLVLRSRRQTSPIIPIDLLKDGVFTLSVATSIASFSAQMLAFVSLPFYFEGVLHHSQVETGLLMTPWPLAVGIGAPIAGRLTDRLPGAILSGAGLLVLAIGLVLLAFLPANATTFDIVWRMALCGLGFGFFQAPNNRSMLSVAPMERSGAAGGMLATARLTGQTTGATLAAISFRLAGQAESVGLAVAAALAGIAAIVSVAQLLHPAALSFEVRTGCHSAVNARAQASGLLRRLSPRAPWQAGRACVRRPSDNRKGRHRCAPRDGKVSPRRSCYRRRHGRRRVPILVRRCAAQSRHS